MKALRFAVIGSPVGHSKSPGMHQAAFAALGLPHTYEKIETMEADLSVRVDALRRGDFAGLNVTVPHKTRVLDLVDDIDPIAARIGAANTLVRTSEERVRAHNTDAPALAAEIARLSARATFDGGTALVLGFGRRGTGRDCSSAHDEGRGTRILVRARAFDRAPLSQAFEKEQGPMRRRAARGSSCGVPGVLVAIIQATSLGMKGAGAGEIVANAVAWDSVPSNAVALDVVCTPRTTPFLARASARNLTRERWARDAGPSGRDCVRAMDRHEAAPRRDAKRSSGVTLQRFRPPLRRGRGATSITSTISLGPASSSLRGSLFGAAGEEIPSSSFSLVPTDGPRARRGAFGRVGRLVETARPTFGSRLPALGRESFEKRVVPSVFGESVRLPRFCCASSVRPSRGSAMESCSSKMARSTGRSLLAPSSVFSSNSSLRRVAPRSRARRRAFAGTLHPRWLQQCLHACHGFALHEASHRSRWPPRRRRARFGSSRPPPLEKCLEVGLAEDGMVRAELDFRAAACGRVCCLFVQGRERSRRRNCKNGFGNDGVRDAQHPRLHLHEALVDECLKGVDDVLRTLSDEPISLTVPPPVTAMA